MADEQQCASCGAFLTGESIAEAIRVDGEPSCLVCWEPIPVPSTPLTQAVVALLRESSALVEVGASRLVVVPADLLHDLALALVGVQGADQ